MAAALTPASTRPARPTDPQHRARLFFVRADRLTGVERGLTSLTSVSAAVAALLEGPTEEEVEAGTRTAIAAETRLRSATVEDGTASIDVTGSLVEIRGQEQILAVGQLVLTVTAVPGVQRVRFLLDGKEVEVPRAEGTLVASPLTAADYASLRLP